MVRGPFFDENGVKKGAWSEAEDERLKTYILNYGHPNWRQLPKLAGLARCGKSCRLRWMNYLRPNLRQGNYTPQEEEIILKLHEQHGNKWSLIAKSLPGRTDNHIKNHWHSHLKWRSQGKGRNNSEPRAKKPSHNSTQHSESDIMKVVSEFNNILESSSLQCTETTSSTPADLDNSASLASMDMESTMNGSPEEDNSVASCEVNRIQEFSGDFWTEPFISESTYSKYYYPNISGRRSGDLYPYDGTQLFY